MNLSEVCKMEKKEFRPFGKTIENPLGELIFQDNNAPILGVAHLDSVSYQEPVFVKQNKGIFIICPQLDDRLGVWTLLNLKFNCDILLTDCEETGKSTGQFFHPEKQYNWIFSFDRGGTDAVTYDYWGDKWDALIAQYYQIGWGSFSDICFMEHLGCKGVNVGIGYYKQHTLLCHASIERSVELKKRFEKFTKKYSNEFFPHESKVEYCFSCQKMIENDWLFCPYCGTEIEYKYNSLKYHYLVE